MENKVCFSSKELKYFWCCEWGLVLRNCNKIQTILCLVSIEPGVKTEKGDKSSLKPDVLCLLDHCLIKFGDEYNTLKYNFNYKSPFHYNILCTPFWIKCSIVFILWENLSKQPIIRWVISGWWELFKHKTSHLLKSQESARLDSATGYICLWFWNNFSDTWYWNYKKNWSLFEEHDNISTYQS